jgi:hypothetical protein
VSKDALGRSGGLILGGGLGLFLLACPPAEGLLTGLSMTMASCSFVVIAGPFVGSFLPATGLLALFVAAIAPWG